MKKKKKKKKESKQIKTVIQEKSKMEGPLSSLPTELREKKIGDGTHLDLISSKIVPFF
jgi:hypothetical protein